MLLSVDRKKYSEWNLVMPISNKMKFFLQKSKVIQGVTAKSADLY